MLMTFVAGAVVAASAATVTISPASGVSTNVAAISGTTDVAVNPKTSGGGIVTLDAANAYTGLTTLGCGTLVASALAKTGTKSSLGKSGEIRLGPGTFRFTGASATTDRPFTNSIVHVAGGGTKASVWDIRGDLTLTGRFAQQYGGFVKTGAGTLNLAATGLTWVAAGPEGRRSKMGIADADYRKRLVFNENGDSPSVGFSGLTVAEGKLVMGANNGTYNVNGDFDTVVGTWTAAAGEPEKSATWEICGGRMRSYAWTVIGQMNGSTSNTRAGQSCIRVTGGVSVFDHPVCFGRNKPGYASYPQLTYPCWEQTGGSVTIAEKGLCLSDDRGALSTAVISGGVLNAQVISGRMSGSADTWGKLYVCGTGLVNAGDTYVQNTNLLDVVVSESGRFGFTQLRSLTKGRLRLLVDGGTLVSRLGDGAAANWISSTVASAAVGSAGATFELVSRGSRSEIAASLTASNTVAGAKSPGVVFRGQSPGWGAFVLTAAQGYDGATEITCGATVALTGAGALPAKSAVRIGPGGGLETLSAPITLPSLTLGDDWSDAPVRLGAAPNAALRCTGTFAVKGGSDLAVALYAGGGTDEPRRISGTMPVLTVPASQGTSLASLRVRRANPVAGQRTSFTVVIEGGSATLTATTASGDEAEAETRDIVTSLAQCRQVAGRFDLSGRALVITDLQHLSGRHTVLRAAGGVAGEFAETNLDGTGYRAWTVGNRVVISREMPPGMTLIVR